MMGREDLSLAELAHLRSRVYLLLAAGFTPPSAPLVRRLRSRAAFRATRGLARAVRVPALATALATLGECLARWRSRDPRRVIDELSREHQRLFLGPYHLEAPPYESCYRGRSGAVMGEAAVEVLESYWAAGLAPHPGVRDLPDHIAIELEFVGFLAGQEARLRRKGSSEELSACLRHQERFLAEHLALWITPFAERVSRATRSPFYRALATATDAYVASDRALVGALTEAAA